MKIILQRVEKARVEVDKIIIGKIDRGYLLLVGFDRGDSENLLEPMLDKVLKLKLFPDENNRFNHSIKEIDGSLLIVSQFTLSANIKKGNKPSFSNALEPELAEKLYDQLLDIAQSKELPVASGSFGAMMQIHLQNDGPVTIPIDSRDIFPSLL
ncbi:MAG: D-tyrosyl-tRNA(Tyr) deacylase [Proteobacteria bacterium]|nr:D-tyrosyl-tRNA(Tyr) deacylase [Pseudomonadota bacterium]